MAKLSKSENKMKSEWPQIAFALGILLALFLVCKFRFLLGDMKPAPYCGPDTIPKLGENCKPYLDDRVPINP